MAKTKKISVNAFERAMHDNYTPTETFLWNDIEITVKKTLSFKEMFAFVDKVVNCCFANDTNSYMPEVEDFMKRVCVLEKYANFTMPSNLEAQYALVYQTDAVERVLEHVNYIQYEEICFAATTKISNLAQANIEAINTQMNKLYSAFEGLQTQFTDLFGDINSTDIRNMTNAIINGELDEEKLVKAYKEAYKDKGGNSSGDNNV